MNSEEPEVEYSGLTMIQLPDSHISHGLKVNRLREKQFNYDA